MSNTLGDPSHEIRLQALLRRLTTEQVALLLDLLDDISYVIWNTRGDDLADHFARLELTAAQEPPDPPNTNPGSDDEVPF